VKTKRPGKKKFTSSGKYCRKLGLRAGKPNLSGRRRESGEDTRKNRTDGDVSATFSEGGENRASKVQKSVNGGKNLPL